MLCSRRTHSSAVVSNSSPLPISHRRLSCLLTSVLHVPEVVGGKKALARVRIDIEKKRKELEKRKKLLEKQAKQEAKQAAKAKK